MKIEIGEDGELRLKNVFNSVVFETKEGKELVVCMRDGAFEIAILDRTTKNPSGQKSYSWYYANSNGIFYKHKKSNTK